MIVLVIVMLMCISDTVNREVAKWLEQRPHEDTAGTGFSAHSSKFDIPTASVGLAGTQLVAPYMVL